MHIRIFLSYLILVLSIDVLAKDPKRDELQAITMGFKVEFGYSINKDTTRNNIKPSIANTRVSYKSKTPFAEDSSGKWFMRLSLDILEYADKEKAKLALDELRVKSKGVLSISKCQDYIVRNVNIVYWISAPCHFWNIDKLERNFNKTMKIKKLNINSAIRCRNGGFCK